MQTADSAVAVAFHAATAADSERMQTAVADSVAVAGSTTASDSAAAADAVGWERKQTAAAADWNSTAVAAAAVDSERKQTAVVADSTVAVGSETKQTAVDSAESDYSVEVAVVAVD